MKLIGGGWRTCADSYITRRILQRYSGCPGIQPDLYARFKGPYCERRAPVCPKVIYPEAEAFPTTSSISFGAVVPIPTRVFVVSKFKKPTLEI